MSIGSVSSLSTLPPTIQQLLAGTGVGTAPTTATASPLALSASPTSTAVAPTSAIGGAAPGDSAGGMLQELLSMMMTMLEQLLGGGQTAQPQAATGAAPVGTAGTGGTAGTAGTTDSGNAGSAGTTDGTGAAGNAGTTQPAAATTGATGASGANRPLVIAQIDDFNTDSTGFNHGQSIAQTLQSGGGDPSLAGNINLLQYQASGSSNSIAGALGNVIQKVQSGQTVDAVELPQDDFNNDAGSQQVRQDIDQLKALGVPVVVAAGNNGPGNVNQLADGNAITVANTQNGQLDPNSGVGNTQFEGRTTSFASANLAPIIALQHAEGLIA